MAVRREVDVEASPEEVWEALATEEGRDRWLEEPHRDIQVEVLDAPHRLVWRWSEAEEPATVEEFEVLAKFNPKLGAVKLEQTYSNAFVDQALKQIPPAWVTGDEEALSQLCEQLLRRRKRVVDLLEACRRGRVPLFPEWR